MKINPIIIVFVLILILLIVFTVAFPVSTQESLSNNISSEKSSLPNFGAAPELQGIKGWINSQPLKIEQLKGKVVLVDF